VEIEELRSSVQKLANSAIPPYQTEKYYGSTPRALFTEFAKHGLTGLTLKEDHGGLGLTIEHCAAVMEEIAAVDLGPAIFLSVHLMACAIIERFGDTQQHQKFLEPMTAGTMLGAFALTEPSAGSDASNLRTTYKRVGEEFIIDGEKCYITSAGWADIYILFARQAGSKGRDGISGFIVPSDAPGLTVSTPEKKMGCELSPIASLTCSGLRIPCTNLLQQEGRGYAIALSGLAGGRINIAACANGLSRIALQRAVDHLKTREQFGHPLIEFQGLQFMLADMKMKLEAARLLTREAAQIFIHDQHSPDNRLYPSMAKCFATDAAMQITTDAVQLLGGAGYIKEYQVERLMRDAKMLQIVEGTNQVQRGLIARALSN